MITAIEITARAPFVGGAEFGATGAYERLDGVAIGELDPAHPAIAASSTSTRHRAMRVAASSTAATSVFCARQIRRKAMAASSMR